MQSKKHKITYIENQIKDMTPNQWIKLIEKKVNDTYSKQGNNERKFTEDQAS